jgi:hypothetical protein
MLNWQTLKQVQGDYTEQSLFEQSCCSDASECFSIPKRTAEDSKSNTTLNQIVFIQNKNDQ